MEEIQIQFLHLSMASLKSSRQNQPLPPLKMMALSVTWGKSSHGGDSSSVSTSLSGVTEVFSTEFAFAALKDDGSVVTWGDSSYGGDSSSVFYISFKWGY